MMQLLPFLAVAQQLYTDPTFGIKTTTNVTYCSALTCKQDTDPSTCTPMTLQLDVYEPVKNGSASVPSKKPAYILSHGGGNSGGSKEQFCFQGAAMYYAARGFVAFNINYRLSGLHGLLPAPEDTGRLGWNPNWQSGYPAVRDLKAAIRFVKANAEKYGIDPTKVVVSGGSAGATNSVAVGATFEGDYGREMNITRDPTLSSTHLDQDSSVACVVAHWSSDGEILLPQQHDPLNRTRYSKKNAPIIEFHGDKDTTIPIAHALAVQSHYKAMGVPYELHVLKGCAHGPWCYDGKGACGCSNGVQGYGQLMDEIALPFVAKQLGLPLN